jgi:signal transduction histidine kinase
MWDRLLALRTTVPWIHRIYVGTIVLNLALVPFALFPSLVGAWLLHVVKFANYLNAFNFAAGMVVLAARYRSTRQTEYLLYFAAFAVPAISIAINTGVNQGLLQQTAFTSNVYIVAILTHVLVMSLGQAMRVRQLKDDKAAAEQAAALAAQRAEEQRRFVAMLSHEFGNPLAGIDRATQLLQLRMQDLPEPDERRLAQIRANVATLSGYLDSFLTTEALDHGGLKVMRERTEVRPLLEAIVEGVDADGRVRLAPPPAGETFDLDPNLMRIALGNLLANALRYGAAGTPVDLAASLDAAGLHIRVQNEGARLSDDELRMLGTPYFRATSSLGKKGTGLGYYFSRHIVQAHGGRMTASSEASGLAVLMVLPWPGRGGG